MYVHRKCSFFPFNIYIYLDAAKCVVLSIFTLIETNCQKNSETLLPSNAKWPLPAGAHNLVPVDIPYYLNYLNDTHTILSRKQTQK